MKVLASVLLVPFLSLSAFGRPQEMEKAPPRSESVPLADDTQLRGAKPNPATPITASFNAQVQAALNFGDRQDFEDAQRNFVATVPGLVIKTPEGYPVYDLTEYDFLNKQVVPDSVNPSLWRLAQLNLMNGLFQVTDNIYQVRSFDVSNMTIVEGDKGIIIIDPISTTETAKAAINLYYSRRGTRPVMAVIYTHTHVDHYGGVRGVITSDDIDVRKIPVIAPEGFLEAAVSENVYVGTAMGRRTVYWYGTLLDRGERGNVDAAIGKAYPTGTITLVPPNDTVKMTGDKRSIDGVDMEFQMVSGTEAPSEFTIFFPKWGALNAAEIACPLMHNILTLRGAQVRDSKKWAESLNELLALYGDKVNVVFGQHHWPKWGRERAVSYIAGERDMYKYLHDQTLRLTNLGYTGIEIAEMLTLPPSIEKEWWARGYYGTLSHNIRAIYQKYIGWYDGNPANLHALPPAEAGAKLIQYMGGSSAAIAKARKDYDRGEYRWVAWLMGQVAFAEPENWRARYLAADAFEQLGYQAEAGTWRNSYLVGAYELRHGVMTSNTPSKSTSPDTITAMTMPMYFDYMGIRLNGQKAEGRKIVINWSFTDTGETYALNLSNCALTYRAGWLSPAADTSLTLARTTLDQITLGQTTFAQAIKDEKIKVTGNPERFIELMSILDTFPGGFPIVTP